jgi:hypothetical protein
MVRALALLYESTGGNAWRNNFKWMSGEPCVDGWFGVHCCPQALPVLRGDDECTADGGGATGVLTTQGSAACHSGSVTGTALDLATCVVVKVLLPSNNLIGSLDGALCGLQNLQHLDLSGNALIGALPSTADCLQQLTSLDLTVRRGWEDPGGFSGHVPEWLLDRLDFMAPLRLANNAFHDPTAAESAVAISRLWQRCSTLGAEQCSGVPPTGCSAFNRQGQRYEVELNGLGCVRCPTPLEVFGIAGGVAGIVLLFALLVGMYTIFVRRHPEYAKTHVASGMILVGHLQTLSIIGSLQLGWPLVIQEILASISLQLMGYIPLPCILTDPVLKAVLSYAESAVVMLLLVGAWLVARRRRDTDGLLRESEAWSEYFLSVLFSLLFTVGLRASATLFARYDEDQSRQVTSRFMATLLWFFWLFLFWRFRRLLREAQEAAREAALEATRDAAKANAQTRVRLRRRARRAAEAVRYLTERYASDDGLSHGDFLLWAEKHIDDPVRERLADGTIRLLRCAWLLSADSDKHLGRDASGRVIMRRRQELPEEEAFFTNEEAVALLDRADRSILALSYRWLTALHPDPHGMALLAVRRFLRSEAGLDKCGMFWDFTSLPQKDIANGQRTPEEADTMKRGLAGMGNFYASTCGTAVVQLKDIPPRPSEYDGRMIVFDQAFSESTSEKDVRALLERFGGKITKFAIKAGEAHVIFATHEQAERCIAALREEGRSACTMYNETAYSRDCGEPFSGWCTFEQGVSKLVAAHLNKASRQAKERSAVLPERLKRASDSRDKVTDISDGQIRKVVVTESPDALLKKTNEDLGNAIFVGKGEGEDVKQLLAKFEWSMNMAMEQATAEHVRREQLARAQWPLRSQWQLVVWARQGLLFLLSFAMDCVMWLSPYEEHRTTRYVFAALAIAVLGGFWKLQDQRQPYAMHRQHRLEVFLYVVDILVIFLACLYGALTNDGAVLVDDASGRLALELGLGALLIVSVVGAVLVVVRDVVLERSYIRQRYLDATQFFDVPIVAAIRDGAVRLIDYAWLLDRARLDEGQLPRVTKVEARLTSNEPTSVLIRRLATHCGTSSICITVAASLSPSPPPSPPEVAALAEIELEDRSFPGHLTRFRHELAEVGLAQFAHAIIEKLGIRSVEKLREFTFDELQDKLKAAAGVTLKLGHTRKLKAFLAASPSGTELGSIRTVMHERTNASHAQSSTASSAPLASQPHNVSSPMALQPQRSRSAEHDSERNESAHDHAKSMPGRATWNGSPPPSKVTTSALPNTVDITFHLSTFDDAAPLTAAGLRRKAVEVYDRLVELGATGVHIVTGAPFLPRCQDMPLEAFLLPKRAADLFARGCRSVDVVSYCRRSPGVPDHDGRTLETILNHAKNVKGADGDRGLFVDFACIPQTFAWPSWHASEAVPLRFGAEVDQGPLTVLKFECERVATEDEAQVCVDKLVSLCEEQKWSLASIADLESLGLRSRSVLFHGRYISGEYRFDEGADAEGYVRFCTKDDADAARRHPKLVDMFGGKEPRLMGERVFENELKSRRALSVMGSLYASATGTCVLQLTDPPGELGDDNELVSEHTGTVFVVELEKVQKLQKLQKSLEELQKALQNELGDMSLEELQKALQKELRKELQKLQKEQKELQKLQKEQKTLKELQEKMVGEVRSFFGSFFGSFFCGKSLEEQQKALKELQKKQKEQKELQKEQKEQKAQLLQKLQKLQKSLEKLQKELVGELRSFFGSFFCSKSLEELQKELQKELGDKSLEELQKALQKELGDGGVLACEKKGSAGVVVVRVLGEKAARAARSPNEGGYPLRRKDRVVYPMRNLRPYGSCGWPTFETAVASIVLAHLTQHKRGDGALPPAVAQAEKSIPKLINIDTIDRKVVAQSPERLLRECEKVLCASPFGRWRPPPCAFVCAEEAQSAERLLRECKLKLRSKRIFFTGKADRKQVVQLLSDFEDLIAVEFDQKRAKNLKLRTEDLEHAHTAELREARRRRSRKEQESLRGHVEDEPTHKSYAKTAVATKDPLRTSARLSATPSLHLLPQKLPAPQLPQRYPIASRVFVTRNNGAETLAYVKAYDAVQQIYTVELEQLDSKKFKKCDETSLREANMLEGMIYSISARANPARSDDDFFDA